MSNLLEKASIITTPTAYSDGKLHSVKPKEVLGDELVTNGSFDTDSGWSKSNATISGGKATITVTGGGFSQIFQSPITYVSGKKYKVTAEIQGLSGSNGKQIRFQDDGSNNGGLTSVNGLITLDETLQNIDITWTANNNSNEIVIARNTNSGDYSFTIDNVSVKEETDADFDFQRGSAATRVNSQGLIENVQILSGELVTNGDFSNGETDWNLTDGATITDNGVRIVSDGTIQKITQNNILTVGKQYKIQYEILENNSGELKISSSFGLTPIPSTVGTHTVYAEALQTFLSILRVSACDITISNISVIEITDDTDLPRIDYTDGCGSLLLEPQSTNLITHSEDFSNVSWTKGNTTITSNSLISPSGILNASTLTDNTANTIHRLRDSVSLSASTDYGLSIFAKKGTLSNIQLALINTANSNTASRVFDLQNGALGESITVGGTLQDSKITDYGNGWYRCEITAQLGSTPNTYQVTLATQSSGNSTTGNQVTYDGDGNGNVYLWGGQIEQLSYATSYIPTNGATATRLADVCNNSGSSDLINSIEGVLYAEISAFSNTADNSKFITISDGTYNNRASILFSNGSTNQIRTLLRVGGVSQIDLSNNVTDVTDFNKVAFSYKENDFKVYINGSLASSDTSGSVWSIDTITKLSFSEINTSTGLFNGKIKSVAVFKEALTNDELEGLTGEGYDTFNALALANNYTII